MLLGFAGSPWTLACYMVEGGSSQDFARIKALFREDRACFDRLMDKLAAAVARLLTMQLEAGADAVQIFDSWAAACPEPDYAAMSLAWIERVIAALPPGAPIILFAKGMAHRAEALAATGARALGIDWTVDLPALRRALPETVALQGNLDPALMSESPEAVRAAATKLLSGMAGTRGHIVNLGHGIRPDARIDCVEALVECVRASAQGTLQH